jgi:hypothetical protein
MNDETQEQEQDPIDPRLEAIKAAFTNASNEEGNDEDAVKLKMIQAGAKFSEVTRLFNLFMVEFGFTKSKEEKQSALDDILTGEDLTNEETFNACSEKLMDRLEASDKSANALIRQWAKKNDLEYFKPVKEARETSNFDDRLFAWIIDNVDATDEQFEAHLVEVGSDNTLRFKARHFSFLRFAQSIKAKYAA